MGRCYSIKHSIAFIVAIIIVSLLPLSLYHYEIIDAIIICTHNCKDIIQYDLVQT